MVKINGNIKKFVISLIWTILVTVFLHYATEKPVKRIIFNKKRA